MNYKRTGELILSIRKERGLTQKELAEELHISDRTVSKWERGIGFPDVSLLEPLAKSLDLSISEIVLGEKTGNSERPNSNDERTIKLALSILREETVKQMRKKTLITSIAIAFPFFISIFFWSYLPSEIAMLIGTKSPYASKLFAFTIPPIIFLVANAIHIARMEGRIMSDGNSFSFPFPIVDIPTNTLLGKLNAAYRRGLYWIFPVLSFIGAITNYVSAFRTQ